MKIRNLFISYTQNLRYNEMQKCGKDFTARYSFCKIFVKLANLAN